MHAFALAADAGLSPISIKAEPSGLAVSGGTLFVADGGGGAVLRLVKRQQTRVAAIASGGAVTADRLGGIAAGDDGSVFVSRLGPRANAVFQISPTGNVTPLPRLDADLWRHGLAFDPDDRVLYATQFARSGSSTHSGSILEIDITDGHSTVIAGGFTRPIGVAKVGSSLVVLDADKRAAFRVDLRSGRAIQTVSLTGELARPDAICADDNRVLVSCFDEAARTGIVKRVTLAGHVTEVARGPWEPRGIATDGEKIYVAARGANRVLVFDARR